MFGCGGKVDLSLSYGLSGFFYGRSQVSRSRVSQSVIRGDGLSVLL